MMGDPDNDVMATMAAKRLPARQPDPVRDLVDWAETILCNVQPMAHCTQADFDALVQHWRERKHQLFPDGSEQKAG